MIRWVTAFLDTENAEATGAFWSSVTGFAMSPWRGEHLEFATLMPRAGDAYLRVQRTGGPSGVHLDLHVDDPQAVAEIAVAAGARVIADLGYVVLASPAGLAFCLVPWHGESDRPEENVHGSLLDQVCLDLDEADFPSETRFWSTLTRWRVAVSPLPEFASLERPVWCSIRLIFQRRQSPSGSATAHPDLACVNRPAEVQRHLDLGAVLVRRTAYWTTLLDPAGLTYCLTDRDPVTGRLPAP